MTDGIAASAPLKRRRWPKILAALLAVFVVLIVAAYLWVTSSAFFKGVILPHVSTALNADVTVNDATVHPFSEVTLHNLKVQAAGQEPVVTADTVTVRYHLWDILHGNIRVDEVTLASPIIQVVENPDGSRNIDPILKALQAQPTATNAPAEKPASLTAKPSKPLQLDLAKLTLSGAEFREIKNYAGGNRDVTAVTNINLTVANVKNGETAKIDLSAGVQVDNHPPKGGSGSLAAELKGNVDLALTPELKLASANGGLTFAIAQATGIFAGYDAFSAGLKCEVTPTEIKQFALDFQKAEAPLGELAVSGPFDAAKTEGKLNVTLHGIDRRLLNLAGARSGIDFGTTTMDAATEIDLAKAGAAIVATGKLKAGSVQIIRDGQTTPTLDFTAAYDVTVDSGAKTATLRSLTLAGTQNGVPLLDARLSRPMNFAWGSATGDATEAAAFDLNVTNLNLADWQPFLGHAASAGMVGLNLQVSSRAAGRQISFDLKSRLANLTVQAGTQTVTHASVNLSAQGEAADFKQVTLKACALELAFRDQPAFSASAAGTYDLSSGDADLQVKAQAKLARLLQALPQPGMQVSAGDLGFSARVRQKQKSQTLAGNLALDGFDGVVGKNEFHAFGSKVDFDLGISPTEIQINKLSGNVVQNGTDGGSFDVSGNYQPAPKTAQIDVKLAGLNEKALRPFLQPLLAGKNLASVKLAGTFSGNYQPHGTSAVKADVQLSNLVVNDPRQTTAVTPLAAGFKADASLDAQTAAIRQFQVTLTPTDRAANQLQFSGQINFASSNAIQGDLKLAADSLDLTRYYDLLTGATNAAGTSAATAPPPTASATTSSTAGNTEPAAVKLPLQNFTLAATIGQLYLHTVAITNFQTTVTINGGHVVIKPFQLALNGGPANGTVDLDLGVPGYKYNVAFDAKRIPIAPLVDTFQPARAGQMGGTLTASAQIAGAGITGPSLQKNLAGKWDVEMTNLNLAIPALSDKTVWEKCIKLVVNVVSTIPDLAKNPVSGLFSLGEAVLGHGGLMNDMVKAPISFISLHATAGNGLVNLRQSTVRSTVFEADATGTVTLMPILTNSTLNVPITVLAGPTLAGTLSLSSSTNGPATAYTPLPQFLTIAGTAGDPKAQINKVALAGLTIRSVGGAVQNVGGLINQLQTNAAPAVNLLNQLLNPNK
jgi:uncharacterized protein involved in outer membrane biogenesis